MGTGRRGARELVLTAFLAVVVVAWVHHSLLDVGVYRAGARAVLDGHALYSVRVGAYGFTYPPFAAVVFTPLALLSPWAVLALLAVLSTLALAVVVRVCAGAELAAVARGQVGPAVLLGLLVFSEPVELTLANGQVNLVLAALVVLDLLVLRRGPLVGLAAAVKLTPLAFVLYLCCTGRRVEARRAVTTFVAAAAVGAIALPSDSQQFRTHEIVAGSGIGELSRADNQSLRGLAERAFGDRPGTVVWVVLALPVLALGLWLARRASTAGRAVLAVGVVGVTSCLVSPVSWPHHWVWAVPALMGLRELVERRLHALLLAVVVLPTVLPHPTSLHYLGVLGCGYTALGLTALCWAAVAVVRHDAAAAGATLHSTRGSAKPGIGTRLG